MDKREPLLEGELCGCQHHSAPIPGRGVGEVRGAAELGAVPIQAPGRRGGGGGRACQIQYTSWRISKQAFPREAPKIRPFKTPGTSVLSDESARMLREHWRTKLRRRQNRRRQPPFKQARAPMRGGEPPQQLRTPMFARHSRRFATQNRAPGRFQGPKFWRPRASGPRRNS